MPRMVRPVRMVHLQVRMVDMVCPVHTVTVIRPPTLHMDTLTILTEGEFKISML